MRKILAFCLWNQPSLLWKKGIFLQLWNGQLFLYGRVFCFDWQGKRKEKKKALEFLDPDAGKDWKQKEKGTTEDEMVG